MPIKVQSMATDEIINEMKKIIISKSAYKEQGAENSYQ